MKRKIVALMMLIILLFTSYAFADSGTAKKINTIAKIIDENTVIDRKFSAVTSLTAQNYNNKDYSSIVNIEQSNEPTYFSESKKFYIQEYDDGNDENTYTNRYIALKMKKTDTESDIYLQNNNHITFTYTEAIIDGDNKYDLQITLDGLQVANVTGDYDSIYSLDFKNSHNAIITDNNITSSVSKLLRFNTITSLYPYVYPFLPI